MSGWELWGVKATLLLVAIAAGIIAVIVRLIAHDTVKLAHIDGMAGDEGED